MHWIAYKAAVVAWTTKPMPKLRYGTWLGELIANALWRTLPAWLAYRAETKLFDQGDR